MDSFDWFHYLYLHYKLHAFATNYRLHSISKRLAGEAYIRVFFCRCSLVFGYFVDFSHCLLSLKGGF